MAATNSSTLHRAARPVAVPARMWLQARACAVLAVVALLVACDTGGPAAPDCADHAAGRGADLHSVRRGP